jgi:hypothetical protein
MPGLQFMAAQLTASAIIKANIDAFICRFSVPRLFIFNNGLP